MNIVKKTYKKSLIGSRNEDQVNEMVMKQEAIPEIRFKLQIFNDCFKVQDAFDVIRRTKILNNGVINQTHIADVITTLIRLFDDLKVMIIEKKLDSGKYEDLFNSCIALEYDDMKFNITELLNIKNYLIKCMGEFKLNNLLITNTSDDDDYINRMIENEY